MYPAVLVLSAVLMRAQDTGAQDATALLTAVANNVRSAKSWRIEGHVTIEYEDAKASGYDFTFAWRTPGMVRYEKDDPESGRTLIVCDGAVQWTYSPRTNHYTKLAIDSDAPSRCGFPAGHWQNLLDRLMTAIVAGHDTIEIDGRSRECEEVRAEYAVRFGQQIRTMCIDPDRLVILREKMETDNPRRGASPLVHRVESTTYRLIERDGEIDPGLFVFAPPPGSTGTDLPKTYRIGAGVSPPVPIYRPDPRYPKNARRKRIEGTVILAIVVETDGTTSDIHVVKPLDPDLDRAAMECVGTWRFRPGEKDGHPVRVMAQIEVNFRLLDNQ